MTNGLPPQEVINLSKAPHQHNPTIINTAYRLFQFGRAGMRILSMTNPIMIAKSLYETAALPLAQATGSQTIEKCARVSIDVLGAVTNLPGWAASRSAHFLADKAVSYVPNATSWTGRAIKDIANITASEAANYCAAQVNEKINAVRQESLKKLDKTQEAIASHKQAQEEMQKLETKSLEVAKLSTYAQELVNNAKNIAESKGLKGNPEQIAIELSRQVNALSIATTNPERNTDTFMAAQAGSSRNQNKNLVARTEELITAILQENQQTLQHATAETSTTRTALLDQLQNPSLTDAYFEQEARFLSILNTSIYKAPELEKKAIDKWIQEAYVKCENGAKAASNKKFAIATGMADSIMELLQTKDTATKDYLIHTLLNSMDDSSRRWYNDVCGKTHELLTGTTTNQFAYKHHHGIKKGLQEVSKPIKKTFKWLNEHGQEGEPVTIGAQISGNGKIAATVNNIPVYTVRAPTSQTKQPLSKQPKAQDKQKKPAPKEESVSLPITPITDSSFYETLFADEDRESTKTPSKAHESPKQVKNEKALNTLNASLSLAHEGLKKATGYSGLGKIGNTLSILAEIDKGYGPYIGTWNVAYQAAVCSNVYSCTAAAASNLYVEHVPQESVRNVVTNITLHAEDFKRRGNLNGSTDLMAQAGIIQSADLLFRKLDNAFQAGLMTPEKVQSLQASAIKKIDLLHKKSVATEAKLMQQAESCGSTRAQKAQKEVLTAAAKGLHIVSEKLQKITAPKKKSAR